MQRYYFTAKCILQNFCLYICHIWHAFELFHAAGRYVQCVTVVQRNVLYKLIHLRCLQQHYQQTPDTTGHIRNCD